MKFRLNKISIQNLAALVGSQLEKHGIDAVLTGGACVTIFSVNKYQSLDLDFVINTAEYDSKTINSTMLEIGFKRQPEGFFEHQECPFIVEFIPPPLAVGREQVKNIVIIKTKYGSFRLLSPTDCVKDRLAAYYHWNDLPSLDQALMVARRKKINLKEIKHWSKGERHLEKYSKFEKQLKSPDR